MLEYIKTLPPMVIAWASVLIMISASGTIYSIIRMRRSRAAVTDFFAEHPDAAKVYGVSTGVTVPQVVEFHAVDGQKPLFLAENGKYGIVLTPGEHRLQISSSRTHAGIVHASVTHSTGTMDRIVEVKANGVYELSFDRHEHTFSFKEVSGP